MQGPVCFVEVGARRGSLAVVGPVGRTARAEPVVGRKQGQQVRRRGKQEQPALVCPAIVDRSAAIVPLSILQAIQSPAAVARWQRPVVAEQVRGLLRVQVGLHSPVGQRWSWGRIWRGPTCRTFRPLMHRFLS